MNTTEIELLRRDRDVANNCHIAAVERHHALGLEVLRLAGDGRWVQLVEFVRHHLDAVDAFGFDDDEALYSRALAAAAVVDVEAGETP